MTRKRNDGGDFWYILGVLTAILLFPFTFMDSWSKTQRRKRRR